MVLRYSSELSPAGEVADYDRANLALYAALLDADAAGIRWEEAATNLMGIDVTEANAQERWRTHLDRARWIIGDGLAAAILAFGQPFPPPQDKT